jgi:hypothetical protein
VVGQWVRGERFYGREAEIAALLPLEETPGGPSAPGRRLWVAGLRRIGKTSLLRQLELLALEGRRPVLPLLWDLEGIDGAGDLAPAFADALLDAADAVVRLGVPRAEIEAGLDSDPCAGLERLHRALAGRGAELLLLCDEADRLAGLARSDPELVRRLWRAAAGASGRVVLASSVRLADLAAGDGGAAACVEGFGEPLLLGAMTPAEARELVRQSRLPPEARPAFDDATVEAIRERCGDHPMLLQLAGRRRQETGDLDQALRLVAAERTVDHLFEVDLALLTETERRALRAIARAERDGGAGAEEGEQALERLLALGLLRRTAPGGAGGGLAIRNRLLAAWLLR